MGVARFLITLLRLGNSGVKLGCPPAPVIGVFYQWVMQATGPTPPYKIAVVGALPPGLVYSWERPRITGTPTTPGAWPIRVIVTGRNRVPIVFHFTLTVLPLAMYLDGKLVAPGVGLPISGSLVPVNGTAPYALLNVMGSVPGITFSMASSRISATGTVTAGGTFPLTFLVVDSSGRRAALGYVLTVAPHTTYRYTAPNGDPYTSFDGNHYTSPPIEN